MAIKFLSNLKIGDITFPTQDGAAGQVLATDGAGNLSFVNAATVDKYINGLSFSGGTLTASVAGGSNVSVSLDGRYSLTSHDHAGVYDNYQSWNLKTNGVQRTTVQSGGTLDLVAGSNVSLSYSAGGVVTISSTDTNTNYYVTSASFNTTSGILTLTRNDGGTVGVDLDGKYSELGHTHDDRYYTETEIGNFFSGSSAISGYNKTNWDSAYGWGNHASAGYLTSATLPAPLTSFSTSAWAGTSGYPGYTFVGGNSRFGFSSSGGIVDVYADGNFYATDSSYRVWHAGDFSSTNISNWNTAYGWGNHASAGYATQSWVQSQGYITGVTNISGYSGTLIAEDNRTIAPSELEANRMKFGFTSWNNNNTSPYADFIHLRSYQDSSGGLDNLVMFRKDAIGMRIYQQTYGSSTAYSSYKDVAFTDSSITGNAGTATTLQTARAINGTAFNGSADITTSFWGSTRTITIGNTGKSVNGSGNVSWTLAEIGAYAATNPNGYTSNTGTVTSVSGTGSYGGLTLTGTVTGSGSLTLGGTPSGTWPISITGSSGSVSGLTLNSSGSPINPDNVTQNQIGYNNSVSLFGQTDGGLYSSAYSSSWIHQIYGDFRTGQIAIRGKNNGTWQSWRTVLDSSNFTSYAAASSHTHTPSQVGLGNVTNDTQVAVTYNTTLNSDTRNRRGVTRLFRRDDDSDYSVQTYWTGSYWRLYGYNGDSGHADTHVGYSDSSGYASSAGNADTVDGWHRDDIRAWGNITGKPSSIFTYDGWVSAPGYDANTIAGNKSGFTYANNAPYNGPLAHFESGGYGLQLNAPYSGTLRLSFRTRNGDSGSWNGWIEAITSNNIGSQSVNYASSAGSVAWSNVSSKPSNLTYWDTWYGSSYLGSNGDLYMGWAGAWTSTWFNQAVRTDSNPTFAQVYSGGWFRNYGYQGLYNQDYGNHWYARSDSYWTLAGNNGSAVGIQLRTGGHEGSLRGYVYADSSNQIGFLNTSGSWSLRCDNSGNVTATADLIAYSDARLKENIETIDNALQKVISLRGVSYNRIDTEDKSTKLGLVAQEVQAVLPEVVYEQEDGILGVSYGNIVGVLIEAMKEQQAMIETLEAKIELLTKFLK